MAQGLWQFRQMGLLPTAIEFPLPQLRFEPEYGGDYLEARRHAAQCARCVTVEDGADRMCLLQIGSKLLIFGSKRGTALHILLLQGFARLLAGEFLPAILEEMRQELNFCEFSVRIGDQRSRWGSCSKRSEKMPRICLNWRALLLPPGLLRQLCLHELCHLRVMNHSAEFHALLAQHNPREKQDEHDLGLAWKNLPPWCRHRSHFVIAGRTFHIQGSTNET